VVKVVFLDSGPLGLLANPNNTPQPVTCRQWLADMEAAGHRLIVPEITDYEVRRELLRLGSALAVSLLNGLGFRLEYLPIDTRCMRKAAELWALARQKGKPTAGDNTIDADMILIAQALTFAQPNTIIATTNLGHFRTYIAAELWSNITP
jgi:predicted nucleic acid-binding protein